MDTERGSREAVNLVVAFAILLLVLGIPSLFLLF